MKFSAKTEYGLQALVNLAKAKKGFKSAQIIAREEGISLKYLERLLNLLRKKELIESAKGKDGGYTLAKPASQISLAEIVLSMEDPIRLTKCFGMTCHKEKGCSLKKAWQVVGDDLEKTLSKIKLKDLL